MALLRLAAAVEVPAPRLPGPGEDVLTPGGAARVVGFGDTRDGTPPGVRRQGGLRVTEVRPDAFLAGPDPAMSCVGDSGGPVLVRDAEGGEVLVGVTVSGDFACQKQAVNLRVDAVRDSFLQPFLDERPEPPGPELALDALCTETCTRDADCPAGLACAETADASRRCFLPALQPGDYGVPCAEDAQCGAGGVCARLEPEGDDACRCFTPCAEPVSEPASEPSKGRTSSRAVRARRARERWPWEQSPRGCTSAGGCSREHGGLQGVAALHLAPGDGPLGGPDLGGGGAVSHRLRHGGPRGRLAHQLLPTQRRGLISRNGLLPIRRLPVGLRLVDARHPPRILRSCHSSSDGHGCLLPWR
ncbi:trypsin-like serine protease [Cystobacter fuscus]